MTIGSGSHVYEVIDDWGNLPDGLSFGTTHGVVEDSHGRIYIHHTNSPCVVFKHLQPYLATHLL